MGFYGKNPPPKNDDFDDDEEEEEKDPPRPSLGAFFPKSSDRGDNKENDKGKGDPPRSTSPFASSRPPSSNPFGRPADKPDDKKDDPPKGTSSPFSRPGSTSSPFGRPADKPDDKDKDKNESQRPAGNSPFAKQEPPKPGGSAFGRPATPSGSSGSPFGRPADKPDDKDAQKPASSSPFGRSEPAKPATSAFGKPASPSGTSSPFGRPADKPADKKEDPPKSGGLFGRGGDNKPDPRDADKGKAPDPKAPAQPARPNPIGGLFGRGGSDKPDPKDADKGKAPDPKAPAQPARSNPIGGLFGRGKDDGDKKDDKGASDKKEPLKPGSPSASSGNAGAARPAGSGTFGSAKPPEPTRNDPAKPTSGGFGSSSSAFGKPASPGTPSSGSTSGGLSTGGSKPYSSPFGSSKPADPKAATPGSARPADPKAGDKGKDAGKAAPANPASGLFGRLGRGGTAEPAKPGDKGVAKPADGAQQGGFSIRGMFSRNAPATTGSKPGSATGKKVPSATPPTRLDGKAAKPLDRKNTDVQVKRTFSRDQQLDLIGIALVALGAIVFFGILSPGDPNGGEAFITGTIVHILGQFFGYGRYVLFVPCFVVGGWLIVRHFGEKPPILEYTRLIGWLVMFLALVTTLQMVEMFNPPVPTLAILAKRSATAAAATHGGGLIGDKIYMLLMGAVGDYPTFVFLVGWWVIAIMLAFEITLAEISQYLRSVGAWFGGVRSGFNESRARSQANRDLKQAEAAKLTVLAPEPATAGAKGKLSLGAGSVAPPPPTDAKLTPATPVAAGTPAPAPAGHGVTGLFSRGKADPAPAATPAGVPVAAAPAPTTTPDSTPASPARGLFGSKPETAQAAPPPAEPAKPAAGSLFGSKPEPATALAASPAQVAKPFGAVPPKPFQSGTAGEVKPADAKPPEAKPEEKAVSKPGGIGGLFSRGKPDEKPVAVNTASEPLKPADPAKAPGDTKPEDKSTSKPSGIGGLFSRGKPDEKVAAPVASKPGEPVKAADPVKAASTEAKPEDKTTSKPSPFGGLFSRGKPDDKAAALVASKPAVQPEPAKPLAAPAGAARIAEPAPASGDTAPVRDTGPLRPVTASPFGRSEPAKPDALPMDNGKKDEPARPSSPFGQPAAAKPAEDRPASPFAARTDKPDDKPASSPFGARPASPFGSTAKPAESPADAKPIVPATPLGVTKPEDAAKPSPSPFGARPASPFGQRSEDKKPTDTNKPDAEDTPRKDDMARPASPFGAKPPGGGVFGAPKPAGTSPFAAKPATNGTGTGDDEDEDDVEEVGDMKPATSRSGSPFGPRPGAASPFGPKPVMPAPKPSAVSSTADDDEEEFDDEEEEDEPKRPTLGERIAPASTSASTFGAPKPVTSSPFAPKPAAPAASGSPFGRPAEPAAAKPEPPAPAAEPVRTPVASAPAPVSAPAQPAPPAAASTPPPEGVIVRSKPPGVWDLPDYSALLEKGSEQKADQDYLRERARIIEDTLQSFGAPGKIVEINTGPVITQFGVEPDYLVSRQGKKTRVKVSSIAKLDADLALALAARTIRIEAPVPGKGYVGIEVPNTKTALVSLRDIMDEDVYRNIKSRLRIALGRSVDGQPIVADLTAMPHLLIAGTTGSGKSVCVNAIITTLLLENSPEDLRFIMVDPKRVELTGYNGIPHLVEGTAVVVDLERIVGVLKWVTREMEERYKKFAQLSARNISDYNTKIKQSDQKIPYLVVVIDELADLMMLAPEETEKTLARLAQMARATGIHLIVSTQRPSVDVVTGLIKANFPARISFAVASSVDSRVILDQPGAEKLLGRGDMLYQSPDAAAPVRIQGVYLSDAEINGIVQFWKTQKPNRSAGAPGLAPPNRSVFDVPPAEPVQSRSEKLGLSSNSGSGSRSPFPSSSSGPRLFEKDPAPLSRPAVGGNGGPVDDEDELYEEAVKIYKENDGKVGIQLLQRRLRVGYMRAARLIELMKQRGLNVDSKSAGIPDEHADDDKEKDS